MCLKATVRINLCEQDGVYLSYVEGAKWELCLLPLVVMRQSECLTAGRINGNYITALRLSLLQDHLTCTVNLIFLLCDVWVKTHRSCVSKISGDGWTSWSIRIHVSLLNIIGCGLPNFKNLRDRLFEEESFKIAKYRVWNKKNKSSVTGFSWSWRTLCDGCIFRCSNEEKFYFSPFLYI